MHCLASNIATASKDCSMAVSKLEPSGKIQLLRSYEQQHAGAVKCARWQDQQIVATCGNDM